MTTKTKTANRQSNRRKVDTTEFANFLSTLDIGVTPTFHINGPQHYGAVVTVDLGQPLQPKKLTPEQGQELISRMRRLTAEVLGKNLPVSVDHDKYGILWTSVNVSRH